MYLSVGTLEGLANFLLVLTMYVLHSIHDHASYLNKYLLILSQTVAIFATGVTDQSSHPDKPREFEC